MQQSDAGQAMFMQAGFRAPNSGGSASESWLDWWKRHQSSPGEGPQHGGDIPLGETPTPGYPHRQPTAAESGQAALETYNSRLERILGNTQGYGSRYGIPIRAARHGNLDFSEPDAAGTVHFGRAGEQYYSLNPNAGANKAWALERLRAIDAAAEARIARKRSRSS